MEKIEKVIFYSLDKAIRLYRQYAQKQLKIAGHSITIDQWLVLKKIQEHPEINQQELGIKVFKDTASVTRIIELLVRSGLLQRDIHHKDRRRRNLALTRLGTTTLEEVQPIILQNRKTALAGISSGDLDHLQETLQRIVSNITEADHGLQSL